MVQRALSFIFWGFYHQSGYQLLSFVFHLNPCFDFLSMLQCNCRQWYCSCSVWLDLELLFVMSCSLLSLSPKEFHKPIFVSPRILKGIMCMYRMATGCALSFFSQDFLTLTPLISSIGVDYYVCEPHCQLYFKGYRPPGCWEETWSLFVFEDSSLFKSTLVSSLQQSFKRHMCVHGLLSSNLFTRAFSLWLC